MGVDRLFSVKLTAHQNELINKKKLKRILDIERMFVYYYRWNIAQMSGSRLRSLK